MRSYKRRSLASKDILSVTCGSRRWWKKYQLQQTAVLYSRGDAREVIQKYHRTVVLY